MTPSSTRPPNNPRRPLKARWADEWLEVWRRDDPYHYVYDVHLDADTGTLVWVDNPASTLTAVDTDRFTHQSERLESDPDRFERIPPLSHDDHQKIFSEWLARWPRQIRESCDTSSLGVFIDTLTRQYPEQAEGARGDWHSYHEVQLRLRAEQWLQERGFAVEWEG